MPGFFERSEKIVCVIKSRKLGHVFKRTFIIYGFMYKNKLPELFPSDDEIREFQADAGKIINFC